ncbi:hypothetical protein Sjap_008809 [Stephania japonica]|uniref:Uncharacterized protein n=1 Tax=Stephania japonica TaxID=461633 RepID=A0AAP0JR48_9MAGN
MDSFSVNRLPGVMVRPSEPTPPGTLNLSVIDRVIQLRFYFTVLFVFRDGNKKAAKIIKEALSKALVPYYPLAGRLQESDDDDEELRISCTGEGVWFVEAYADSSLADFNYLDEAPQDTQEKLIPDPIPAETMGLNPIMLMQVTSFKCGGFVTVVTINHCTCDGTGICQFLNALGEFARGVERPSVEPLWLREIIPSPSHQRELKAPQPSLIPQYQLSYASLDFPAHKIDQIKRDCSNSFTSKTCTTFEVLTAGLWRSRTRAINLHPNSSVKLIFFANIRRFLNPPAPHGFYGNCIFPVTIVVSSRWLVEAPLAEVVKLIQEAKARLQAQYNKWMFNKGDNEVELIEEPFTAQLDYATLFVSSGKNIGLDSVDYGWGPPLHEFAFLPHPVHMHPIGLLWPPMKPKTGIRLSTWCVDDSHLQAMKDELMNLLNFNS